MTERDLLSAEDRATVEAARVELPKAHAVVVELCRGERTWIMRIPAQPDDDPGLVIGRALRLGMWLLAIIDRLTAEPPARPVDPVPMAAGGPTDAELTRLVAECRERSHSETNRAADALRLLPALEQLMAQRRLTDSEDALVEARREKPYGGLSFRQDAKDFIAIIDRLTAEPPTLEPAALPIDPVLMAAGGSPEVPPDGPVQGYPLSAGMGANAPNGGPPAGETCRCAGDHAATSGSDGVLYCMTCGKSVDTDRIEPLGPPDDPSELFDTPMLPRRPVPAPPDEPMEVAEARERAEDPDPDMILDCEGLYDDASTDRATLLAYADRLRDELRQARESRDVVVERFADFKTTH